MGKGAASPLIVGICLSLLAAGCGAGSSSGEVEKRLTASMSASAVVTPAGKAQHVPPALVSATAALSGTISADRRRFDWKLTYAKLGNPKLVIADIHAGKRGAFGAVLLRLCGPCRSGKTGATQLTVGDAKRLLTGDHWITLITDAYPNGAVRGQIRSGS